MNANAVAAPRNGRPRSHSLSFSSKPPGAFDVRPRLRLDSGIKPQYRIRLAIAERNRRTLDRWKTGGNIMRNMQSSRLPALSENTLTPEQRALAESIRSGPRGQFKLAGPFAVYLHAPAFGELAQKLGGHLRFKTSVPGRLSEFAILVTAQHWKAQYEWAMHVPMAEKQGVKPQTIRDIQAGRAPKSAPRDELAIYAFAKELYAKRRVSTATFNRVRKILGDAGTVELVGILGYYALVSMILNTFRMPLPEGIKPGFREPS
jgi:4-carboxymuconolactone decarboxylase